MPVICIFGDSITYGAYDRESGGWVGRLRHHIDNSGQEGMVYNLGVDGETTNGLLKRLKIEIESRLGSVWRYDEQLTIVFAVGVNDSALRPKRIISNHEFSENIRKLAAISRKYTKNIFFADILPVSEQKVNPVPWDPEITYLNREIRILNDVLNSVCFEENARIIKVKDRFEGINYHRLLDDGLHPNSAGHELIFKTVKEQLTAARIIS